MKKKISLILICLLMVCATFAGCSLSSLFDTENPPTTYTTPVTVVDNATPNDVVNACINSVVTIFVVNKTNGDEVSFGSGVAVASGGYIATNYHVISTVASATSSSNYELQVYHNQSETAHTAEILWYHTALDCAIVKCSCEDLPFVSMTDRNIETTNPLTIEQVVAIGTPIDFALQNTATVGYISSTVGRVSYSDGLVYENLIQHTAPINHGNSGGALFDMTGKLIGLNTLGHDDAHSLFFAIPIYPIVTVIDRVVDCDKNDTSFTTPVIGFSAVDRNEAPYTSAYKDFDKEGLLITAITEQSGSVGKLEANDRLVSIKISDKTYEIDVRNDLIYALLKANKGDTVTVEYIRGIIKYSADITLG